MTAQILRGNAGILPAMEGCCSCRLGYSVQTPTPIVGRRKVLMMSYRLPSTGMKRCWERAVKKSLHRRTRNMKKFKLSQSQILKELEEEETEDEPEQVRPMDIGDNSPGEVVTEVLQPMDRGDSFSIYYHEVVSEVSRPFELSVLKELKEKMLARSDLSVQNEGSRLSQKPKNDMPFKVSDTIETGDGNGTSNANGNGTLDELKELETKLELFSIKQS